MTQLTFRLATIDDVDALLRLVEAAGAAPLAEFTARLRALATLRLNGTITDFLSSIEYWERKQSMAILGGTLTSQADGKTSTNAQSQTHENQFVI